MGESYRTLYSPPISGGQLGHIVDRPLDVAMTPVLSLAKYYSLNGLLLSIGNHAEPNVRRCDEKWSFLGSGFLSRSSLAVGFALVHKVGDPHQIIGQHGSAHQNLEPLAAFEQAAFHAPAAK